MNEFQKMGIAISQKYTQMKNERISQLGICSATSKDNLDSNHEVKQTEISKMDENHAEDSQKFNKSLADFKEDMAFKVQTLNDEVDDGIIGVYDMVKLVQDMDTKNNTQVFTQSTQDAGILSDLSDEIGVLASFLDAFSDAVEAGVTLPEGILETSNFEAYKSYLTLLLNQALSSFDAVSNVDGSPSNSADYAQAIVQMGWVELAVSSVNDANMLFDFAQAAYPGVTGDGDEFNEGHADYDAWVSIGWYEASEDYLEPLEEVKKQLDLNDWTEANEEDFEKAKNVYSAEAYK